mmetsp:Transcript_31832/g.68206  ORF Transcript_31832/g.68206 Transcript_31832/m.68206 type:complete len:88 (-) Transcript_31832:243-506(-)
MALLTVWLTRCRSVPVPPPQLAVGEDPGSSPKLERRPSVKGAEPAADADGAWPSEDTNFGPPDEEAGFEKEIGVALWKTRLFLWVAL